MGLIEPTPQWSARRHALLLVVLGIGAVACVLLVPLPERWQGEWQGKFWDLSHVPLFAGLTLYFAWILRRSWPVPAVLALTVAALTELVQDSFGRSGNVPDFVRGALGVFAAVVGLRAWRGPRRLYRFVGPGLAILILLAWPIADALPLLLDAYERYQSFPILADFQSPRQLLPWQCQQAVLTRTLDPAQPARWRARLELLPGPKPYPGAMLPVLVSDWRSYQRLCWSLVRQETPVTLLFSVRSGHDAPDGSNHAQLARTVRVGEEVVHIDLAALARQGHFGSLDLGNIRYVQVYCVQPNQAQILYLQRLWLE